MNTSPPPTSDETNANQRLSSDNCAADRTGSVRANETGRRSSYPPAPGTDAWMTSTWGRPSLNLMRSIS